MNSVKEHGVLLEPVAITSATLPKEGVCSSEDAMSNTDSVPETVVTEEGMDAEPQMLFSVTQDKSAKLICSFAQPTVSVKEEIPTAFGDGLPDENSQIQAKEADNAASSSFGAGTAISHLNSPLQETVVKQEVITDYPESETQQPSPSYCCKYCGQKLKTPKSLWRHEEGHRNGTIYKCRFCNYHTLSRAFMEGHESQHTGIKPFKCDHCEHRTRYNVDMQKHLRVHFSTRKFKCHLCPFQSKWKGGMDKHLLTHSNIRNFSCHLCNARFKRKSGLKTHMTIHSSDKPFKCDKCSYSCRILSMLRMHAKSHSDVRNFACTYPGCTQKCKTRSDLTKHYSVHLETCNFECHLCGKKFKSRHSLNSHIHRHDEKEMDFICNFCNKKLGTRFGLRKHLTQHFSEKKYSCSVCGHKFFNRSNMIKHMMVHDGSEKDFCCPICKFFGKDVSILLTHIGQMHGKDYTYFCEECRKPFSTVLRMKQHVKRCHYEKIPAGIDEFVYNQHCCDALSSLEYTHNHMEGAQGYDTGSSTISNLGNPVFPSDHNLESNDQDLSSKYNELLKISRDKVDSTFAGEIGNSSDNPGNSLIFDKVPNASNNDTWDCPPNADPNERAGADLNLPLTSANAVKSLVIKLERLSRGQKDEEDSSVDRPYRVVPAPPKVVKIGSIGDIGICLASKDSGIRLNLEKRGKKTNKWFMDMEYMSSNYLNRKRGYLNRERLSTNSKKRRIFPAAKRYDSKGKKKVPALVKKVQKNNIKSSSKISSPAKGSPSKKRISVQKPADVSTDDSQRGEEDPLPVNFDVRVKCERLTAGQIKKAMRSCKRLSKPSPSSQKSSRVGVLMSKESLVSSGNKDVTIKCEQLDPCETELGTIQSTSANSSNHIILGTDCSQRVVSGFNAVPHKQHASPNLSLNPDISTKGKWSLPESAWGQGATRKKTKASLSTLNQNQQQQPNKKTSKRPRKGFKKAKTDMAFIEESTVVEDILDSPFQITWKTMRKVEENESSRKRSCLRKELHESATEINVNRAVNSVSDPNVDEKPSWLATGSHLDISLNLLKNSGSSHCSVQVEDIGHAMPKLDSQDDQNDSFYKKPANEDVGSLIEQNKRNEDHPPIHTITLNEFEEEYRRKKKLVAKVNIVPQTFLDKQQSNCGDGLDKRQGNEANCMETKEKLTLKDILKKPSSLKHGLGHNIEIDVPEETSVETPKNSYESVNTLKLSPLFPKGLGKSKVKKNLCNSQPKSSEVLKIKKMKLKKKKKKKTTIALFRGNFPDLQKKATSSTSIKSRNKAKEVIFPRMNLNAKNPVSSRNAGIVRLWKMAFECLTAEVSVKLFDFKNLNPVPVSHVAVLPDGPDACEKKIESVNEQSPPIDESLDHEKAIGLSKIQSLSVGRDFEKMASDTASTESHGPFEDVNVDSNHPNKSPRANIIQVINRQHVGLPMPPSQHSLVGDALSKSQESEYLNGQPSFSPRNIVAEISVGGVSSVGPEDKSQEQSLVCSFESGLVQHKEEIQHDEVASIHPKSETHDEVLPIQSVIEQQHYFTTNPVVELKCEFSDTVKYDVETLDESHRQVNESRSLNDVPVSFTDNHCHNISCHSGEPSDSCSTAFQDQNAPEELVILGTSNTGNEGNAKSQNILEDVSKTSHSDMPISLDTPITNTKCRVKQSVADFLQGREKSLQKLFASHHVKFTPQGLRKYINKWQHLPLPGDFSMDETGLISKTKTDSVELIENGSRSTYSDCSASESGTINVVTSVFPQEGKSKRSHEFGSVGSEKLEKNVRKRYPNVCFGKSKRRGGKVRKIDSVKRSSESHSSDHTDGTEAKTYIKSWTVLAEVHKHIEYDPFNLVVKEKNEDSVILDNRDTGSHETIHHSEEAAKQRIQLTSNPMLCLSEDEVIDVLDHENTPRVSDSDQTPSSSTELPPKRHDSSYPLSTFPEVFFENDSHFSSSLQGSASQNGNLLLESGVLPPSDDICPLPEDFFNDSL